MFVNTFLENAAIDARALSWWAALYGAQGWLYYLVDGWQPSSAAAPDTPLPLGPHTPHHPLVPRSGSSVYSDFSPRRYNPVANKHPSHGVAFSNGDGILVYPGLNGPVSSMRLENFRDGLEDHSLLARLTAGALAALAKQVLSFRADTYPRKAGVGVNVTVDAAGLERVRRRAAELVLSNTL